MNSLRRNRREIAGFLPGKNNFNIRPDIKPPEMDGYEASRQIRKISKKVVIIAQTAHGLSGDRINSLASGCNEYISKPLDQHLLVKLIRNQFRAKKD